MSGPSPERTQELIALWNAEIYDARSGFFRHPHDYTAWDGLIECDEVMTYEEWSWCAENFRVDVKVVVSMKEPEGV